MYLVVHLDRVIELLHGQIPIQWTMYLNRIIRTLYILILNYVCRNKSVPVISTRLSNSIIFMKGK